MASPISVDIKFDINKAMETVGAWVAALITRLQVSGDAKAREVVPRLAAKLATQAGLNKAFAEQLANPPFNLPRSEEKMRELQAGMKDIVDLLRQIDPQFGAANTDLIASLTASINFKEEFLWQAKNGQLFNEAFRDTVAKGMRAQSKKLLEAANTLSAAAARL